MPQAPCHHGELEVAPSDELVVANHQPPHLERVGRHCVLGGTFLVFAIHRGKKALGLAVALEPVEGTPGGEVRIAGERVGVVPG